MEITLEKIETNEFKNLNMVFKDNNITGIYDEDNTNISEIISFLCNIKKGIIKIDNNVYSKLPKKIRTNIGYVSKFANNQIFNKTIKKEFEISFRLSNKKFDIDKVIEIMNLVELSTDYLTRNPLTLSSGEIRKLVLALSLVNNPKVLIWDSPFIGLDSISKKNIIKLIKKIQSDYKLNIILITNNIEDIYALSNYVYILKNGRIILEGDRSVIYRKYDVLLNEYIMIPKLVEFSNFVLREKYIKLGYRYEINDLIKDIYRNAR